MGPARDFAVGEEWAYASGIRHLLAGEGLRLSEWASPTLIVPTFWGLLWCLPGGFGYGALHLSTLPWALAALAAFWALSSRVEEASPADRRLAAALLVLNPLFFYYSALFMTDIPGLALTLGALALGLKGAEDKGRAKLWGSSALASLAYLTRQTGLLAPIGTTLALADARRLKPAELAAAWAAPLLVLVGHQLWWSGVHGPTWASEAYNLSATWIHLTSGAGFAGDLFRRLGGSALYFGLFSLPWMCGLAFTSSSARSFAAAWRRWDPRRRALWIAGSIGAAAFAAGGGRLPYANGTLTLHGMGQFLTLFPDDLAAKASGPFGSLLLWRALTIGACLAWSGLLAVFLEWTRDSDRRVLLAVGVPLGLQWAAALAGLGFLDRYLLPLLPMTCLAGAWAFARWPASRPAAWTAAAALFLFGWLGTLDGLNARRALWEGGKLAVSEGLRPEEVDAGLEWDGHHTYEGNMRSLEARHPLQEIGPFDWLSLNPLRAAVRFQAEIPGTTVLGSVGYWTPWGGSREVYVHMLQAR